MSPAGRPEETAGLLGHGPVLDAFRQMLGKGRVHHAWALLGPRGIGKATLAWHMVREWFAENEAERLHCHRPDHPLFSRIRARGHPDLHLLEVPEAGAVREIPVAAVREVLARLKSTAYSGRRALLVDAACELNRHAANALLKMVEEPPRDTLILLVCHRPRAVPATLLSRCLRVPLRPLQPEEMEAALARWLPERDADSRRRLAVLAAGRLGEALRIDEAALLDHYRSLLGQIAREGNRAEIGAMAAELAAVARRFGLELAFRAPLELVRRVVRLAAGGVLAPELAEGEEDKLRRLLARRPAAAYAELWAQLVTFARRAQQLHLDPQQALLAALGAILGSSALPGFASER